MAHRSSKTYQYHYVTPRQYRWRYRYLAKWQQRWHRYERAHPCNATGIPVDNHAIRTISVGSTSTLESMICEGLGGKIGDPLKGFLVTTNPNLGDCDPYRVTVLRPDSTMIDVLAHPLLQIRLSSKRKKLLRLSSEKLAQAEIIKKSRLNNDEN